MKDYYPYRLLKALYLSEAYETYFEVSGKLKWKVKSLIAYDRSLHNRL